MEANDEININQLPDEMLVNVFENMDSEALKSAALVCKKWHVMIGQSSIAMKQLPLSLEGNWVRVFQHTKNFTRKFHTVKIDNSENWNENTVKVLRKNGSEARFLEFSNCEFELRKLKCVPRMFGLFQKLEVLNLSSVSIDIYEYDTKELSKIKPTLMPHLKKVVLDESTWATLEFIRPSQLKSLKINSGCDEIACNWLLQYLAEQKNLEELALHDVIIDFSECNEDVFKAIQLPLKKLSLLKCKIEIKSQDRLIEFLGMFTKTLEKLEMGSSFPDNVYEMIFKKFHKLKVLKVNVTHAPTENVFYHNLRQNPSIKQLIITGFRQSIQQSVEGFIGNMPNIEALVIEANDVPKELLVFITNNLLKLEYLHLKTISSEMLNNVRITSLKSLSIKRLSDLSHLDWKSIVKAFPNIEKLTIEQVLESKSLNDRMFNIITKGWRNLTHLKLGFGFVAVKRVFNQLLRNCPNLKTVELADKSFTNLKSRNLITKDFKKEGLRFIIHTDDCIHKIFPDPTGGLWTNEETSFDPDESDDEWDDDDEDENEIAMALMGHIFGGIGRGFDSSDDNNEFIYFDSDGEMRRWDEDPGDYGIFDDYYLD